MQTINIHAGAVGTGKTKNYIKPQVEAAIREAQATEGTVVIDFRVEQEDSVYPMVPAGADLNAMIRRPNVLVETPLDQ